MQALHREPRWHDRVQCALLEARVDFSRHVLWVTTPPGNVPDMRGAIAWATTLDPDVWDIAFFHDGALGTHATAHYTRDDDGRWRSVASVSFEQMALRH